MKTPSKVVKFQLDELLGIGMTFVVLGIALAYGLQIMGDTLDDIGKDDCAARSDTATSYNTTSNTCYNSTGNYPPGSAEFNGTSNGIIGVEKIPTKLPTIATVVVAAIILGILTTYLWDRFK
tara:strand:- start:18 stop:383 length:366 start_codon:yes stop_codon:yes gene_type:complete